MLVSSGAPLNLWGETIISACHIQNRIPYKKTGKTPYELWKGYAPNITYLKVCGCLAKVLSPNLKNENQVLKPLMQCSLAMLRIVRHIGFLLLIQKTILQKYTIIEIKNVNFFESIFPKKLSGGELQVQKTSRDEFIEPSKFEPRRSKRDGKETNLENGFYTFLIDEDPRSYKETITLHDAPFWKEAINSEIKSIMYNHR